MMEWIANLFGVGQATMVDDDGEMQRIQVTERAAGRGIGDRISDRVRRVVEFGFTSVPPLGSEVLVGRLAGERSQSMVIGTSHRPSRPRGLKPGDTCLYDVRGARVEMTATGLVIDCAGLPATIRNASTITLVAAEKIRMETPVVEMTGELRVAGKSTLTGDVAAGADATIAGKLAVTGAIHGGSTLDVAGRRAGADTITAAGDVAGSGGAASLTALRAAYAAHHHGGVKRGSDPTDGPDQAA